VRILALERPGRNASGAFKEELLHDEAAAVWKLYVSGVIRDLHFTANDHRAVVMLESSSADDAARALSVLALVRAGLIEFELIPLLPYDGFARLFEPEKGGALSSDA